MTKPPKGMIKLSTKPKVEKPNKAWHWDERPSIEVDENELPSIKTLKVGSELVLKIKVRVERVEDRMDGQTGKTKASGSLRVTEIGVDSDESDEYEEENDD